jgi:hypothetical protein
MGPRDLTPKSWKAVANTIPLHLLEDLTSSFVYPNISAPSDGPVDSRPSLDKPAHNESSFDWKPPDLEQDHAWYRECVQDLLWASLEYEDPSPLIEEGMRMIARHRNIYDAMGPKPDKLQLLWWRFPRESWDKLREGCSMNFLVPPRAEITPNSDMDENQICIAEEFVNESVSLGILMQVAEGEMVANGPLFCLPKPGQPGEWRILSDMRRGGQNEAIGSDPTVFPKSSTIVEQLYAGGCSAVVDASKFFYQFPTKPEERKFLGCIHPRNPTILYVYGGLPMGGRILPLLPASMGQHYAAWSALRSQSSKAR